MVNHESMIHSNESLPKLSAASHFCQLCITNQPLFFSHLIYDLNLELF